MDSPAQAVTRYSDADLNEFKEVVEKKLATAYEELEYIKDQINDTTENMEKDSDYMEDSTSYSDLEMFQNMAFRQQKHIQNLENALLRIKNKSYGICTVTGTLIDKRRLLIVPTTTMSIDAKLAEKPAPEKKENVSTSPFSDMPDLPDMSDFDEPKPKVITKVVSKPTTTKPTASKPAASDLDDLDFFDDALPDIDLDDSDDDLDYDLGGGGSDADESDDQ